MTSACRSCGAPIIWTTTEAGKPMPVDEKGDPEGTVFVYRGDDGLVAQVLTGEKLARAREGNALLRVSHFATCPNAAKHRRK